MRDHRSIDHGGDEGSTVLVAIVEVRASLVVVLHEVRERKVAHPVLNNDARGREHTVLPCPLGCGDVKARTVVPTIVVAVVIHVPRVERVGRPVILGRDIVHSVGSVAVFPTVGNAVAVRIMVRRVGDATEASVEILAVKRIDLRHPINRLGSFLDKVQIQGLLSLHRREAKFFLIGRHRIFTEIDDT